MKHFIITGLLFCTAIITQAQKIGMQLPMRAVYDRPATDWESEALPIGNGYMGAMIFGGVKSERIQTNSLQTIPRLSVRIS